MILSSAQLMPMDGSKVINNGAIAFSHGSILAIGPAGGIIRQYPGHRVHYLKNAVLLPGLVNTHTHLELPSLLDVVHAEAFPDWVLNLIQLKKKLVPRDYAAAVKKNIEILKQTGTTTVGEICTHGISPACLNRSGLRGVIFQEIIAMKAHLGNHARLPLRRSLLIQTGISPHSPYTVSETILRRLNKAAQQKNRRLCMHIAESKDEIRLLQGKKSNLEKLYKFANWDLSCAPKGSSSFEYLKRIGLLSPNLLAVHAVQVADNDLKLIKKSGASIAHCPRSNRETGVGRMPLKKFLDAGITVGLGTDSLASVPSLSMWDEMRYALQIHRRDGVTAKDIFKLATVNGAKALGMGNQIGTIEPGKRSDIIAVPLPVKNTGDLYSDLLRETKSSIMTMVDGKVLFRD